MFQDLVSAANCGTANPIAQALSSQMSMNAQLSDVKGMKPVAMAPPPQQLNAGAPPLMAGAAPLPFQQHFEAGPKPMPFMGPQPMAPAPMPMLQRPPSMAAPPGGPLLAGPAAPPALVHAQSRGPVDANGLIGEFARMELQQQQRAHFEDAYRAATQQAGPQQAQGPALARAPSGVAMPPPQMGAPQMMPPPQMMGGAWAHNFRQQMMAMGNSPNPDFGAIYQQIARGPQQWSQEFAQIDAQLKPPAPQQGAAAPAPQADAAAVARQEEDFAAAFAEAQAPTNAFVDEFVAQQQGDAANAPPQQGGGMGMGMDQEMLNKLRQSDDPKWRNSKFIKFLDQINRGEIEFKDNQAVAKTPAAAADLAAKPQVQGEQWVEGFAGQQQQPPQVGAQPQVPAPGGPQVMLPPQAGADWAHDFAEAAQGTDQADGADGDDAWAKQFAKMQQQMREGLANNQPIGDWAKQFGDANGGAIDLSEPEDYTNINWQQALAAARDAVPQHKDPEYKLSANNPFENAKDPMQEGHALWKAGKLKDAILAFEAEVKKHPDNADAWRCIGEAQAENEDEHGAISGLLKCISLDPYNLKALMMLGVSYTNDLEETRALKYLQTWMRNHPDYQAVAARSGAAGAPDAEVFGGHASRLSLHDEVTRMFMDALHHNPKDPDLHTVLGVLFHISNDFDKAIDAFKTACKLKPDDPCLWNKLGATQANSNRSADAVHAYKRALELRPGYVRALANLAISYANQGKHGEAAATYLTTLKHNPGANHVWSYLRISLGHLGKDNLVELTQRKDVELFRPYFQF